MHLCYAESINVGVNALVQNKTETGMLKLNGKPFDTDLNVFIYLH